MNITFPKKGPFYLFIFIYCFSSLFNSLPREKRLTREREKNGEKGTREKKKGEKKIERKGRRRKGAFFLLKFFILIIVYYY